MKIPRLNLSTGIARPIADLGDWRSGRQRAASRSVVILLVMLALAVGHAAGQLPAAPLAIAGLGAALAWSLGVRLVGTELGLLALAARHRLPAGALRWRVLVLAVLAFACEAGAAAGLTGLLFVGEVHPHAVLATLEFGTLAVLWNQAMVARGTGALAGALAPLLPVQATG